MKKVDVKFLKNFVQEQCKKGSKHLYLSLATNMLWQTLGLGIGQAMPDNKIPLQKQEEKTSFEIVIPHKPDLKTGKLPASGLFHAEKVFENLRDTVPEFDLNDSTTYAKVLEKIDLIQEKYTYINNVLDLLIDIRYQIGFQHAKTREDEEYLEAIGSLQKIKNQFLTPEDYVDSIKTSMGKYPFMVSQDEEFWVHDEDWMRDEFPDLLDNLVNAEDKKQVIETFVEICGTMKGMAFGRSDLVERQLRPYVMESVLGLDNNLVGATLSMMSRELENDSGVIDTLKNNIDQGLGKLFGYCNDNTSCIVCPSNALNGTIITPDHKDMGLGAKDEFKLWNYIQTHKPILAQEIKEVTEDALDQYDAIYKATKEKIEEDIGKNGYTGELTVDELTKNAVDASIKDLLQKGIFGEVLMYYQYQLAEIGDPALDKYRMMEGIGPYYLSDHTVDVIALTAESAFLIYCVTRGGGVAKLATSTGRFIQLMTGSRVVAAAGSFLVEGAVIHYGVEGVRTMFLGVGPEGVNMDPSGTYAFIGGMKIAASLSQICEAYGIAMLNKTVPKLIGEINTITKSTKNPLAFLVNTGIKTGKITKDLGLEVVSFAGVKYMIKVVDPSQVNELTDDDRTNILTFVITMKTSKGVLGGVTVESYDPKSRVVSLVNMEGRDIRLRLKNAICSVLPSGGVEKIASFAAKVANVKYVVDKNDGINASLITIKTVDPENIIIDETACDNTDFIIIYRDNTFLSDPASLIKINPAFEGKKIYAIVIPEGTQGLSDISKSTLRRFFSGKNYYKIYSDNTTILRANRGETKKVNTNNLNSIQGGLFESAIENITEIMKSQHRSQIILVMGTRGYTNCRMAEHGISIVENGVVRKIQEGNSSDKADFQQENFESIAKYLETTFNKSGITSYFAIETGFRSGEFVTCKTLKEALKYLESGEHPEYTANTTNAMFLVDRHIATENIDANDLIRKHEGNNIEYKPRNNIHRAESKNTVAEAGNCKVEIGYKEEEVKGAGIRTSYGIIITKDGLTYESRDITRGGTVAEERIQDMGCARKKVSILGVEGNIVTIVKESNKYKITEKINLETNQTEVTEEVNYEKIKLDKRNASIKAEKENAQTYEEIIKVTHKEMVAKYGGRVETKIINEDITIITGREYDGYGDPKIYGIMFKIIVRGVKEPIEKYIDSGITERPNFSQSSGEIKHEITTIGNTTFIDVEIVFFLTTRGDRGGKYSSRIREENVNFIIEVPGIASSVQDDAIVELFTSKRFLRQNKPTWYKKPKITETISDENGNKFIIIREQIDHMGIRSNPSAAGVKDIAQDRHELYKIQADGRKVLIYEDHDYSSVGGPEVFWDYGDFCLPEGESEISGMKIEGTTLYYKNRGTVHSIEITK